MQRDEIWHLIFRSQSPILSHKLTSRKYMFKLNPTCIVACWLLYLTWFNKAPVTDAIRIFFTNSWFKATRPPSWCDTSFICLWWGWIYYWNSPSSWGEHLEMEKIIRHNISLTLTRILNLRLSPESPNVVVFKIYFGKKNLREKVPHQSLDVTVFLDMHIQMLGQ